MKENKQTILQQLAELNTDTIATYIITDTIDLESVEILLNTMGLEDKLNSIKKLVNTNAEEQDWEQTKRYDSIVSYTNFIQKYPNSPHTDEAQLRLDFFEDAYWASIEGNLSEEGLMNYLNFFPNGPHAKVCGSLLDDIPWLYALKQDTIAAYNDYAKQFPEKHKKDIRDAIERITDDNDWEDARHTDTDYSNLQYIKSHPNGRHINQATQIINRDREQVKNILKELQANHNAYSALDLQRRIEKGSLTYTDLKEVFDEEQIMDIYRFVAPSDLPVCPPPDKLCDKTTEVYFWATPAAGRTSTFGALLSAANRYKILEKEECASGFYRDLLCNIFVCDGVSVFPYGMPDDSIAEMGLSLRDEKQKFHRITFVSFAGEIFRAAYRRLHGIQDDSSIREYTLNKLIEYLNDTRNRKIHFFIVPYSEVKNVWPDDHLKMSDYIESALLLLAENKNFKKSTAGIYIIVTKSDRMPCQPHERQKIAETYIHESLTSFYINLKMICQKSGIKNFGILQFSIGDVFAQNLCRFNPINAEELLDILIKCTPGKSRKWSKFAKRYLPFSKK